MKTANAKTYQKPSALVALLKQRGIEIDDEAKAESYLKRFPANWQDEALWK